MPYKDYEKTKENARQNYYANKERKLAQAKQYYFNNWAKKQEQRKKWIADNPKKVAESKKRYSAKRNANPETKQKNRAYNKIKWALHKGTLVKPINCEDCTQALKLDAHHHKGYADEFALDVKWLCKLCHEEKHHNEYNSKHIKGS